LNKIIIGTKGGGKRRKPSGPNLDQNWIMEFPRTLRLGMGGFL
jgi:hypothetical protein